MANHLIIGLGGTGGKILREFRKRYFEEFKNFAPHDDTHIDYLYVDSSASDIQMEDWSVMGNSVKLGDHQTLSVHSNPEEMLRDLSRYPKLNSFINRKDVETLSNKSNDLITSGVASQRRRLGRILFAGKVDDYNKSVQELVTNLRDTSGNADVTFHICAGLAGGTGSGLIMDAIAQIQSLYSNEGTKPVNIHLYLFVPEQTNPYHNSENGRYYQANGYASLLELNGWSVGTLSPIDIARGKNADGEPRRIKVKKTPFESAYLFSTTNEHHSNLEKDNELPRMVADYLFQKTVEANGGLSKALVHVDTSENSGFEPEQDESGKPVHSRRFISFGMQRVVYPETEIKENLAYEFAHSAVTQMLFNNWVDGFELSSTDSFDHKIIDRATGGDFKTHKISDDYLTYEKPLEESELTKSWGANFKDYWQTTARNIGNIVKEREEKNNWIKTFNSKLEGVYNEGFRRAGSLGGVSKFFERQLSTSENTADILVHNIERYLFEEWFNGHLSIVDVFHYLRLVAETLHSRQLDFAQKILIEDNQIQKFTKERGEWGRKFQEEGFFRNLGKGRDNDFESYVKASIGLYYHRTQRVAYEAGIDLIKKLETRIKSLQETVSKLIKGLGQIEENIKKSSADHSLPDTDKITKGKSVFYDAEVVGNGTKHIIKSKTIQDETSQRVRNIIVDSLGNMNARTFENLQKKFFAGNSVNSTLVNHILKVCLDQVENQLDNIATENPSKRMTKVNILEKLSQEQGDGELLRDFLRKLKRASSTYIEFNESQVQQGNGLKVDSETRVLCMPKWEDNPEYRDLVERESGLRAVENSNESEISMITLHSAFPLRYASNVQAIRRAYKDLLEDPKDNNYNKLVMHTESFDASQLPDLFEMEAEEKSKVTEPYIILAYAMGLISEGKHPEDESPVAVIKQKSATGRLKSSFIDVIGFNQIIDYLINEADGRELSLNLIELVKEKLEEDYRTKSQKEELGKRVNNVLDEIILPSCKGGELGKEFKAHEKIVEEIFRNELQ